MPKLFDIREPNPDEGKPQPWQAWTVSVAAMPGEPPCPELQRLDLALRKRRGPRELDGLLERWRRAIEWPRPLAPEPPVWIRNLGERWRAVLRDAAGDPWHFPVYGEPLVFRALCQGIPVVADPTMPLDEVELRSGDAKPVRFKIGKGGL